MIIHTAKNVDMLNIIIPLGISYYTLQTVGYIVDVYWNNVLAEKNYFKVSVCCVYDSEKSKIVLCYEGEGIEAGQVEEIIRSKVPEYMALDVIFRITAMPHNANGKTDRKYILSNYKKLRKEAKEKKS